MNELKPCPFCGSEAELIVTDESWDGPSLVLARCKNGPCSCQTPTLVKPRKTDLLYTTQSDSWSREDAVIKIWNRRANDE